MKTQQEIIEYMLANDLFSQWLGIRLLESKIGYIKITLTVRKEMQNGFGITHGGITYCIADSALAFACNGHGKHSVSIETSISHVAKVMEGDVLIAEAKEVSRGNKIGIYDIPVTNQHGKIVALFKGTVYITDKNWD